VGTVLRQQRRIGIAVASIKGVRKRLDFKTHHRRPKRRGKLRLKNSFHQRLFVRRMEEPQGWGASPALQGRKFSFF
jgi:hypothetical protein